MSSIERSKQQIVINTGFHSSEVVSGHGKAEKETKNQIDYIRINKISEMQFCTIKSI